MKCISWSFLQSCLCLRKENNRGGMKANRFHLLIIIFSMLALSGCYRNQSSEAVHESFENREGIDTSCSYFYFLWGSHAERSGAYSEALQAYQKALVCDAESQIIREKIPVLLIKSGRTDDAVTSLKQHIQDYPDAINFRLMLARLYLQLKQYQPAVQIYNEVLKIAPDHEEALFQLGSFYLQQGRFDNSEKLFLRLLKNKSRLYFTHVSLGRLYTKTEDFDKAEDHYSEALLLNWSPELVHEIGNFYKNSGRFKKLSALYEEYVKTSPYDEYAQYGLAEAYLELGDEQKAIEQLNSMRDFVKAPYTIDLIISKLYISHKNNEPAIALLSTLLDTPAASEARFLLAILYSQDNPEKALDYLKDIKNDFFDFENAIYLQAKLFRATDQIEAAIEALTSRIAIHEDRKPSFYTLLSALYQLKDEPQTAIEVMNTGIGFYPDNGGLLFELALIFEQQGESDKAIATMEKVILLEPENAEALNFVGYTWADQNRNLEEALGYIVKANNLKPNNGFILDSLGWVYYRLGNLLLAERYLLEASQQENTDPHIYDHLGDVYTDLGDQEKAAEAYNQALTISTDIEFIKTLRQKIETLTE